MRTFRGSQWLATKVLKNKEVTVCLTAPYPTCSLPEDVDAVDDGSSFVVFSSACSVLAAAGCTAVEELAFMV